MSTSQTSQSTESGRKASEAAIRAVIATHAPAHARLINAARKHVQTRLPTAQEIVYEYRSWIIFSYSPNDHGIDGVLAIRAEATGVKFYFNRGKGLSDPEKLLKGTGSMVRYIDLDNAATLTRPAVANPIEAAIAANTVPFATSGDGGVILRLAKPDKPSGKKATAKKPPTKKTATKKTPAKQGSVKKVTTKESVTKKTTRRSARSS